MRAQLQQTHSGPGAVYRVMRGGEELYHAVTQPHPLQIRACISQNGQARFRLAGGDLLFRKQHPSLEKAGERRNYTCEIRNAQDEAVGSICHVLPKGLRDAPYDRIELFGREWIVYQVGLGSQGLKFPVYEDGRQIALLEKQPVAFNNLDVYELYALEQEGILLAALFGVYYDWKAFAKTGEYNSRNASATVVLTLRKSVKNKYDPSFKERCAP